MTHNDYEEEMDRLNTEIAELKISLEKANNELKYVRASQLEGYNELRSIHKLLDNVCGSPPRNNEDRFPEDEKWRADTYTTMERLAMFFANR